MSSNLIKNIKKMVYYSAIYLLLFLTMLMTITSVAFIFKIDISNIQMILSTISSYILLIIFTEKSERNIRISSFILSIIIIFVVIFVNGKFYDINWDSNSYHKDAVGAMKNGWNPIYEDYIDFYKKSNYRDMNIVGTEIKAAHGLWQTHYAKGIWYVDANFYFILNNIESAKVFNSIILYITLILSYNFLSRITKKKLLSVFIAILFAFSPTVITQLFSYYNDGSLYCSLLCLVFEFILFIKENRKIQLLTIFCLVVICSNIKFTGLAYALVFCGLLYLTYVFFNKNKLNKIIKPTIIFGLSLVVGVMVVGANPYITNFISKGNPLYPLAGKNKVDIVSYNQPWSFSNKTTIEKFNYSIFSKVANINQKSKNDLELKLPFTVYSSELDSLSRSDLRISGFGVYFSGIFVISLLVLLIAAIKEPKDNKYMIFSSLFVSIILLIFAISESWWARYTPYVYFIPLMALTYLSLDKSKIAKNTLLILIVIMFANIYFYFNNNILYNYNEAREMRSIIEKYKRNSKTMHLIDNNDFLGLLYT